MRSAFLLLSTVAFGYVGGVPFQGYTFYKGTSVNVTGLETEGQTLMLNGKPLRILSGTLHYFRVRPEDWNDRLLKFKAVGLNTVETYVPWNLHEPQPGVFDFEDMLNLREFVLKAKTLDMLVIFRPGPYICAEWEFGGLPSWLLTIPNMKVRSANADYLIATKRFLDQVVSQIVDLQFTKDGPVFLVQIENEYGAYGDDTAFMDASAQQLRDAGIVETLVTSDGPKDLEAGESTGVWMTVNEKNDMGEHLDKLSRIQPLKPLMVMEYWAGWFDHWTEKHSTISTEKYALELREILQRNASVNFYVFHGGTSFGFLNGANFALTNPNIPYEPDITSYDYDAPIGEYGQLRDKWYKTREIFQEFGLLAENLPAPPESIPPHAYGETKVETWMTLKNLERLMLEVLATSPMQMENIPVVVAPNAPSANSTKQSYGYASYRISIENANCDLELPELHDRAIVFVNDREVHVIEYTESAKTSHKIPIAKTGDAPALELNIVVENMGRANYARRNTPDNNTMNMQWKGMRGDVRFCGKNVNDNGNRFWRQKPLQFRQSDIGTYANDNSFKQLWQPAPVTSHPMMAKLSLNIDVSTPKDTFIDLTDWGRGAVFVNGFNIGRYWPSRGPQQTLYIPKSLLKTGRNTVLIFELQTSTGSVRFTDVHRLDKASGASELVASIIILVTLTCSLKLL